MLLTCVLCSKLNISALLLTSILGCPPPGGGETDSAATTGTTTTDTETGSTTGCHDTSLYPAPECDDCNKIEVDICPLYDLNDCPTHDKNIQPTWNAYCVAGCHEPAPKGTAPFLDLSVSDGVTAYSRIYQVDAQQTDQNDDVALLVVPGIVSQSYLWHKMMKTQACPGVGGMGSKMPNDDAEVPSPLIKRIEHWICCGAPQ